jgi:uncharacterized protein YecE (DUF72 family)
MVNAGIPYGYRGPQTMTLFAGMSGWAYPDWKGAFYPPGEASAGMLGYYSQQFTSVEINNTYYRMPSTSALESWAAQVPDGFMFAFKANRGITRTKEFATKTDLVGRFCDLLESVGPHLGPVLFQFESRADPPQLAEFLVAIRPRLQRIVVEFRHASWYTEEAFDILRRNDVALCQTETDKSCDPLISASDFSYVRLRKSAYTLDEVRERMGGLESLARPGHDVFCYLKHDGENAVLLRELRSGARAG